MYGREGAKTDCIFMILGHSLPSSEVFSKYITFAEKSRTVQANWHADNKISGVEK